MVLGEALEDPSDPRDNGAVITSQDWIDGWQAARLLGLRADHCQEADPPLPGKLTPFHADHFFNQGAWCA
jgi:hypothetical protein